MNKTDLQLVADYLGGDEGALERLIALYLKPVYNFVYRFLGSAEDAEDVAQEVFIKLLKNIKKYDPRQSFRTWLFAIAKNTSIDWLRKKKNIVFSEFEDEDGENKILDSLYDSALPPDAVMAKKEDQKILERAIKELSPAHRAVLLLKYKNQFTFEEIGQILKKPLDTVKSQYRRALIKLKKILANTRE